MLSIEQLILLIVYLSAQYLVVKDGVRDKYYVCRKYLVEHFMYYIHHSVMRMINLLPEKCVNMMSVKQNGI